MLIVRLKNWLPIEGLEHVGTTWEISATGDFNNLENSIYSEEMLDVFYSDIVVPAGDTYYVRAMRHFNDPTANYWTEPVEVMNIEAEYSAMLLNKDISVDAPMLYLDNTDITNDSDTFVIRTTSYRGTGEEHYCTHWIIKDGIGNVIFSSLYDTLNKTSITITKQDINLLNKTQLTFIAVHCTASGIESKPIERTVNSSKFNFEITSDLTKVSPLLDYRLTFRKIIEALTIRIIKIDILDSDQKTVIYTRNVTEINTTITIPWSLLRPSVTYYIDIHANDLNNNFGVLRKSFTTQSIKLTDILDSEYEYTNIYKTDNDTPEANFGNYVTTHELLNNKIPVVVNGSTEVHLATLTNTGIATIDGVLDGVSLLTDVVDQTYIKYLENNMLLIDTLNGSMQPTFLVYKHDLHTNTYTLMHAATRADESHALGMTNAILQISGNEFIYIPYNTNLIKKYNIANNTLVTIAVIPNNTYFKGTFIPMGKNQILLYGGEVFDTYVFNFNDLTFEKSTSIVPDSFLNRPLKLARLINGDSIVFKTTYLNNDIGSSIKYFDYSKSIFTDFAETFLPGETPTSVYRGIDGSILLTDYNTDTSYGKLPDTMTIYTVE